MKIIISNSSNDPIYKQIGDQIKEMIIKNQLKAGESLPSIRGLARDLQISVITTKRAYAELEKEGLIDTLHGKGSFVARVDIDLMRKKKIKIIEDKLLEIIEESKALGFKYEDIVEIIKVLYREV